MGIKAPKPMPKSNWRLRANCRGLDPDIFYPERGQSLEKAKKICAQCTVTEECLAESMINYDPGVWGNKSERERKILRWQHL